MDRSLRVLYIEDSERDVALLTRHLSLAGYELIFERVETPAAMTVALETKGWDVILCDYSMPEFNALAAIKLLKEMELDIPLIVISGTVGEAVAVQAMLAGAHDYVMKDNLARLVPTIARELQEAENRRARRRAEEAHEAAEVELRSLFAAMTDVNIVLDAEGRYLRIAQTNPAFLYKPPEELIGRTLHEVFPKEQADFFLDHIHRALDEGRPHRAEYRMEIGGTDVWFDGTVSPMSLDSVVFIARDITERKRSEEALRESEERYRVVAETATDVIITIDESSTILFANGAVERVFGYAVSELLGKKLTLLIPEYLRRAHESALEMYVQTGRRHINWESVELPGLHKSGRELPLELSFGQFSKDGKRLFTGIARDITERKRVEKEMRKSEERYRDLVENAHDIIYSHDLKGNYTSVNQAGEEITGYTREESLAMNLAQTVAPECLEKAREMIARNLDGEDITAYDLVIVAKDGRRIAVEVNTKLVLHDGVAVGVQGIARDVTARKRAEAMQIRHASQVALRGEINAALAESNTPLRKILERSAEAMVQYLDAALARIWTLNNEEDVLELQASAGIYAHIDGPHSRVPVGDFKIGLIAKERQPYTTNDVQADSRVSDKEWAIREGMVAFAGYPLIVEDKLVGVMAMFARQRLAHDTLDALASVSDIISQAIERKRVEEALNASEERLRQSQKLEAIGQLAGGIAHDFNNLLTVINGYSDLLLRQLADSDPMHLKVEEIKKAGQRAASLTHQLLAFSRKQVLQPKVLQLNSIVAEVEKMLRRLIGEDLDLLTVLEPSLGQIKADPGQIEQVILNLSVNARDAMPHGGNLTIETTNVYLDEEYAAKLMSIRPGHYVMLAVSDTGCGLNAETKARMFEPFFTTKEPGKGTGLGLSTVYGIVKQSGGNIWVYSELEKGTTFKVYLPRVDEVVESEEASHIPAEPSLGHETVLLTEDDAQVREITRMILEMNGYRVLEAASGGEALSIHREHEGQIDLLVTDLVMPQMNGRELAQSLERLNPGIRVLYMSGYTDYGIVPHNLLDREMTFLQKPFTPDVLIRKVREVLDAPVRTSAPLT